jgi:molybdopterin-guanine dinucleotide biosynthesis protein A
MPADPNATLAIIAGGKGNRLDGVPKGLLILEGRTLLSRLLDLRPLFADALLVTNTPEVYAEQDLRSVRDLVPDRGAPGGVHAALVHARTSWVFAVACDMPFVSSPVVEALLRSRAHQIDVVCFQIAGRAEPLLAVYRCSIAGAWERALAAGPSFRELFRNFRVHLLGDSDLRQVDPQMRAIVSVNTPQDVVRLDIKLPRTAGSAP